MILIRMFAFSCSASTGPGTGSTAAQDPAASVAGRSVCCVRPGDVAVRDVPHDVDSGTRTHRQTSGKQFNRAGAMRKGLVSRGREIAAHHLEDIRAKLSELKKLERQLAKTVAPMFRKDGFQLSRIGHDRYRARFQHSIVLKCRFGSWLRENAV